MIVHSLRCITLFTFIDITMMAGSMFISICHEEDRQRIRNLPLFGCGWFYSGSFGCGGDAQAEMLDPYLYLEGCSQCFNVTGPSFYGNYFEAVVMIKVNMLG